ncbi:hypothetical protein [Entomobacter blattae]|uniref:Uncharacterized protein n=1 Tax=Entomobacter blattae TaxID=2762277 RepID=A0A7H1NUF3_9PROT|nr:hypothetical protein [Entomobacter blattae]QNT79413.1 hypothetical protein JGUZn3_22120 [Entomobacter blattae]
MSEREQLRRACKTLTTVAIDECGGLDATRCLLGVGQSTLSEYRLPHTSKVVPVDTAILLDQQTEHPYFLQLMARELNMGIIPIVPQKGILGKTIGEISRLSSEAISTSVEAMADGVYEIKEIEDMEQHFHRLLTVLERGIGILNRKRLDMRERGLTRIAVHDKGECP